MPVSTDSGLNEQLQLHRLSHDEKHGEESVEIAVRQIGGGKAGTRPGVVWLGGFKSEMSGSKASALAEWAAREGRAFTRFDYSGHGQSSGDFEHGTIGRWLAEAQAVLEALTRGPQILVGSSMGGWLALLIAKAAAAQARSQPPRIAGLVLIAPAADMSERLMWGRFPQEVRDEIARSGVYLRPSAYGDSPYPITARLIEDGRKHLILGTPFKAGCPVRILHGMADPDVPWQMSLELIETLKDDDVTLTLVKEGDHRLSEPGDIARLIATVAAL
jgi:pimeloyl-ACP methyl ester carboxylesterase